MKSIAQTGKEVLIWLAVVGLVVAGVLSVIAASAFVITIQAMLVVAPFALMALIVWALFF